MIEAARLPHCFGQVRTDLDQRDAVRSAQVLTTFGGGQRTVCAVPMLQPSREIKR
jgi:hypothetical protein